MKMHFACSLVVAAGVLLCSSPATAGIILQTNFNGRTVSGNTASNLTWVTDGVDNPGNLTASHPLFDTAAAQNRFAVQQNLHLVGPWSVDVPLAVGGAPIALDTLTMDVFIYNNAGILQTEQRDVDMLAQLLDPANNVIGSDSVLDIYGNAGTISQPAGIAFDFSGVTLSAGLEYTLRLTASGTGAGNNAGIDNLTLNGVLTPEPGSVLAWLVMGTALGASALFLNRKFLRRCA